MSRKGLAAVLSLIALVFVFEAARHAQAQDAKSPYPSMAPLDQYMMADRDAEIALARSAAPESVSRDAEVLVLGRHGYETAVKGTNGFVCLVERSWTSIKPNDPEFWNPKERFPICYNPPASRYLLRLSVKKTDLALAGLSETQINAGTKAFAGKELRPLEPGAMCYMMSKQAYLTDADGHNWSHLMFYVPQGTTWGATPGSPVSEAPQLPGPPEPVSVFVILVPKWSDGTPQ
jgi:hypothetical protein